MTVLIFFKIHLLPQQSADVINFREQIYLQFIVVVTIMKSAECKKEQTDHETKLMFPPQKIPLARKNTQALQKAIKDKRKNTR